MYSIKKLSIMTMVFTAVFFCIVFFARLNVMSNFGDASAHEETGKQVLCFVKEYEGKVGIFLNGSEQPDRVLNVWLDDLPPRDRELLSGGIPVYSIRDLQLIIEDYTG